MPHRFIDLTALSFGLRNAKVFVMFLHHLSIQDSKTHEL